MDIAQNRRTSEVVFAKDISFDNGIYVCKNCGVPVIFIKSQYLKPHFKHAKGKASEECKYASKYYIEQINAYEALGLELRIAIIEDNWKIYLYLPEFQKEAFEDIGLEKLQNKKLIIDDSTTISLIKLWPGKKGFLCEVKPHSFNYKVECNNALPNSNLTNWTKGSKGLDASGVFFRNPMDGGRRLQFGATIRPDNTIYLIGNENKLAVSEALWPKDLNRKRLATQQGWCAWEIYIPQKVSTEIQLWLKQFGYSICKIGYKMELVWPLPYSKYKDNTIVISSNNVIINVTALKNSEHDVLFHKYGLKVEYCALTKFTNASRIFCFRNLGSGLHSFLIDRFSDSIEIFIDRISIDKVKYSFHDIIIKICEQTFSYNPLNPEGSQSALYTCLNDKAPLTLSVKGYEGLMVRVLLKHDLVIKKHLAGRLPLNIDNIFALIGYAPDSIILDFGGFGFFKIDIQGLKKDATSIADMMCAMSLLDKVYLMSLKKPGNEMNNSLRGYIDSIYKLLIANFSSSSDFAPLASKLLSLRKQRYLPNSIKPYLVSVIAMLQKQLKEDTMIWKE